MDEELEELSVTIKARDVVQVASLEEQVASLGKELEKAIRVEANLDQEKLGLQKADMELQKKVRELSMHTVTAYDGKVFELLYFGEIKQLKKELDVTKRALQ